MYLDTIAQQCRNFLYSCGFGFILGLIFDVSEFIGSLFPQKKYITIARDIIYLVVCTFLMFLFNLSVSNGSFKFYIYSAAATGWFVYYFSVGSFTRSVRNTVSAVTKRIFRNMKSRILKFYKTYKDKKQKNFEKSKNSSDFLLQDDDLLLYNVRESTQRKEVE